MLYRPTHHSIVFLFSLSFSFARKHVDLNRCYSRDVACFGSLNGVKSVGNAYGCIKNNNCNILLFAEMKPAQFQFTVVSRWTKDASNAYTRFSMSESSIPFDADVGYIDAIYERSPRQVTWQSTSRFKKKGYVFLSKPNDTDFSVYNYLNKEISDQETLVTFYSDSRLFIERNVYADFIQDNLFIHLEFNMNYQRIELVSTEVAFKLFETKDVNKPPIFIPTMTTTMTSTTMTTTRTTTTTTTAATTLGSSTSSMTPTKIILISSTNQKKVSETRSTQSVLSSTSSQLRSRLDTTKIIIITVISLVIITIIVVILYVCLVKKKKTHNERKRGTKSRKSPKNNKSTENHEVVLERIRKSSPPSVGNSPGL